MVRFVPTQEGLGARLVPTVGSPLTVGMRLVRLVPTVGMTWGTPRSYGRNEAGSLCSCTPRSYGRNEVGSRCSYVRNDLGHASFLR